MSSRTARLQRCAGRCAVLLTFLGCSQRGLTRAPVTCLANSSSDLEGLENDAVRVCDSLAAARNLGPNPDVKPHHLVVPESPGPLGHDEVLDGLAPLAKATQSVVFYTGHGKVDPTRTQLNLLLEGRDPESPELWAFDHFLKGFGGHTPARGWRVALLNTCDSGYANVRGAAGAVTVIGSGYGRVDARVRSMPMVRLFADLLGEALDGDADLGPDGNCDGIVSDREAADHINNALRRLLPHLPDQSLRRHRPLAVVRRQADSEVPIVWHARPHNCQAQDVTAKAWLGALPVSLQALVRTEQQVRSGTIRALPESRTRYLVVTNEVLLSPRELTELTRIAGALGYEVFRAGRLGPPELRALAGYSLGLRLYTLERFDAGQLGVYVSLSRARDDALVWKGRVPVGGAFPLQQLVRALPRRAELYRLTFALRDPDVPLDRVYLRVDGRMTDGPLYLRKWEQLFTGASVAARRLEIPETAPVTPCLGGLGQCFQIRPCRNDACTRLDPHEWVITEVP